MPRNINVCEALKARLTFYSSEEEERENGIVESTCGLGDTGQDGERVQEVTEERREGSGCSPYLRPHAETCPPLLTMLPPLGECSTSLWEF